MPKIDEKPLSVEVYRNERLLKCQRKNVTLFKKDISRKSVQKSVINYHLKNLFVIDQPCYFQPSKKS